MTERCWRCAAEMEWRHGTWQCPRCRFKLGCCEGEPQSCADPGIYRPAPALWPGQTPTITTPFPSE